MFVIKIFNVSSNYISNGHKFLCSRYISKSVKKRAPIKDKTLTKLGIPLPPKKPLNPYLRFLELTRPKIVQSQPDLKPTDIIKLISQEWSKCDTERKKVLQKEYLADMQIYLEKYEQYKKCITPEQINLIKNAREKQKQAKELALINEKKESLGKPKKPTTAFLKYVQQKKSEKSENLGYKDWLKEMAKEWETLPEQVKEKYREESKLAFKKYRSDLIEWEENMIRQGHIDVIKHKDVLDNKPSKQ